MGVRRRKHSSVHGNNNTNLIPSPFRWSEVHVDILKSLSVFNWFCGFVSMPVSFWERETHAADKIFYLCLNTWGIKFNIQVTGFCGIQRFNTQFR